MSAPNGFYSLPDPHNHTERQRTVRRNCHYTSICLPNDINPDFSYFAYKIVLQCSESFFHRSSLDRNLQTIFIDIKNQVDTFLQPVDSFDISTVKKIKRMSSLLGTILFDTYNFSFFNKVLSNWPDQAKFIFENKIL